MNFKSLYIIAAQLWDTSITSHEFTITDPEFSELLSGTFTRYDATVQLLRSNMLPSTTFGATECDLSNLPGYWSRKVIRAYISGKEEQSVFAWTLIIEINADALDEIINSVTGSDVEIINRLITSLLPNSEGLEIKPEYPQFPFCIYLEPDTDLVHGTRTVNNVADDVMDKLKFTNTIILPSLLPDVICLQSLGLISVMAGFTAVGLSPLPAPGNQRTIIIPFNVWKLFRLLTYAAILNYGLNSLKSLPFLNTNLEEYISDIESGDAVLHRYAESFLPDKQDELTLRVTLINRKREYQKDAIEEFLNVFDSANWNWKINTASRSNLPYDRDLLTGIRNRFLGLIRDIEELYKELEYRSGLLSDFLRDSSTTQLNLSNYKLQRRVGILTWVATIFALISLVISICSWLRPRNAQWDKWSSIAKVPTDLPAITLVAPIEPTEPLPTPTATYTVTPLPSFTPSPTETIKPVPSITQELKDEAN